MDIIGTKKRQSLRLRKAEMLKLGTYSRSRASSFANLAAQVSWIPKNQSHGSSLEEEEELDEDILGKIHEDEINTEILDDNASLSSELGYSSEPCTIRKDFFFSDGSADEEVYYRIEEVNGAPDRQGHLQNSSTINAKVTGKLLGAEAQVQKE